jgi:hypothetical protein
MAWEALSTWHGPAMMEIGASLPKTTRPAVTLDRGRKPDIRKLSTHLLQA